MKILDHREEPFPESLEGKLNAILNVVNTELKSITLLHLDDAPACGRRIKSRIKTTTGRGVYLPQSGVFNDYNIHTLFPIGLVAAEDIIYSDGEEMITAYRLTEGGRKYGRPIAAFTLDYVFKKNRSMNEILGCTISSGGSRAPYNRFRILELLRKENLRETDIANFMLGHSGIRRNIEILAERGLISYESCGEMEPDKFVYIWLGKDQNKVVPVLSYVNWTKKVANLLSRLGQASNIEIRKRLHIKKTMKPSLSSVLSGLVEQGFVKRGKWKAAEIQSEAKILDEGRKFLEEYGDNIKDALNDGPQLQYMTQLFEQLRNDSDRFREYARVAINLYRRVSPAINSRSLEENQERIIRYLRRNPGKRYSEIARQLSLASLAKYITPLVISGKLRKVVQTHSSKYYVN